MSNMDTPMELNASKTYLFAFAHPDDDVGIAGTMRMLVRKGANVHCVWATSGDYFGQGKKREAEIRHAMEILGLDQSHVHLLHFSDLSLVAKLSEATAAMTELIRTLKPDVVVSIAFEGGHPDHDSVNFLAVEGATRAGLKPDLFEYPLYNSSGFFYTFGWRINAFPDSTIPVLYSKLDKDAADRKHRMMMEAYSSQWMYMVPARLATPKHFLFTKGEPYRRIPKDRDHTIPPHSGTIGYERFFNSFMRTSFRDFQIAVLKARASK